MPHSLSCESRSGEKPHLTETAPIYSTAHSDHHNDFISLTLENKWCLIYLSKLVFHSWLQKSFCGLTVGLQHMKQSKHSFIFEIGSRHLEAYLEWASVPYGTIREKIFFHVSVAFLLKCKLSLGHWEVQSLDATIITQFWEFCCSWCPDRFLRRISSFQAQPHL